MHQQGPALDCEAAWLGLLQALLPRPAISQALLSSLAGPQQQLGQAAQSQPGEDARPDVMAILSRLLASLGAAVQAWTEQSPADARVLGAACDAVGAVGLMVQCQLRPLVRWLLGRGAVSSTPGLVQHLITLLDLATRDCAGGGLPHTMPGIAFDELGCCCRLVISR